MNMLRNILKSVKNVPSHIKGLVIVAAIVAVPVAAVAYGPARQTYDYNKSDPSDPTCRAESNAFGRCGSMDGPVFNSFVNVPGYGDERNFALVSSAAPGDNNPIDNDYREELTAEAGKEYWMRIYVHNGANSQTNDEDKNNDGHPDGIARNTRVKLSFVNGRANAHDLKATVTADNAATVWDEAVLRSNAAQFGVEYVAGSAKVLNGSQPNVLRNLGDDVASAQGAKIGFDQMNGKLPGCFEFATRVYVKVKVKAPKLVVKKYAFRSGTQEILDGKTVTPDTQITYKSYVFNVGNDVANDVTVRDTLPAGSIFTAGALKLYTAADLSGTVQSTGNENVFFNQGGLNLGNYAPLSAEQKTRLNDDDITNDPYNALLTYKTTIEDDKSVCELKNVVYARTPGEKEVSDDSVVYIDRNGDQPGNGCEEKPTPEKPEVKGEQTPTILPETGAGAIAGIFASTTIAGAVAHRVVNSRRRS